MHMFHLCICFPFEFLNLKVDISLSIDIFLMSVRQRYTQSFALKFTETETAASASCLLSLFYKSMFCCYCECTQINVESFKKLIKSDDKDIYNVTKDFHFR